MAPTRGEEASAGAADKNAGEEVQRARMVELSPDAAESSLVIRVEPTYPEPARQQHIQGPVQLSVHIARDGAVQDVKLISGDRQLADAAIAAVRLWRFKPHAIAGRAVEMETTVTLNFTLPPN
jgi:protein TonB